MKRIVLITVLGLALVFAGGVLWMNNNNSSAIGQKVVDMREKHKNDIIIDANCLLTFENVDGYTVCVTNNDSVIAELKYDEVGMLVYKMGLDPLEASVFEAGVPQTGRDMMDLFGNPHIDVGSGVYLPTYILDDGRLVTYCMNGNTIVSSTVQSMLDM